MRSLVDAIQLHGERHSSDVHGRHVLVAMLDVVLLLQGGQRQHGVDVLQLLPLRCGHGVVPDVAIRLREESEGHEQPGRDISVVDTIQQLRHHAFIDILQQIQHFVTALQLYSTRRLMEVF